MSSSLIDVLRQTGVELKSYRPKSVIDMAQWNNPPSDETLGVPHAQGRFANLLT
jgi:hypothetical protein